MVFRVALRDALRRQLFFLDLREKNLLFEQFDRHTSGETEEVCRLIRGEEFVSFASRIPPSKRTGVMKKVHCAPGPGKLCLKIIF